MPLNKLKFFQNTLALSAVTLIIIVWAIVSFLAYQNILLKKYTKDAATTIKITPTTKPCSSCPLYSPPAPGWCKNGTIIAGEKDECGCQKPPTCIDNN